MRGGWQVTRPLVCAANECECAGVVAGPRSAAAAAAAARSSLSAISVRWDAGRDARAAGRRTGGGRRRRRNRHADLQGGRPDGHQTRLALRPRAMRTCHRPRPQNRQSEVLAEPQCPTRKSPAQVRNCFAAIVEKCATYF